MTNQTPAFDAKSLEHDSVLISSEGQLFEILVIIWKQYDNWFGRRGQKPPNESAAGTWLIITGSPTRQGVHGTSGLWHRLDSPTGPELKTTCIEISL